MLAGLVTAAKLLTYKLDRRGMTPEEQEVRHGFLHLVAQDVATVSVFWLVGYIVHLLANFYL